MAAAGGMPDPKNMNEEEKAAVLAMMKNEMDYKFGLLYRCGRAPIARPPARRRAPPRPAARAAADGGTRSPARRMSTTCWNKCVDKPKEGELTLGENACIDRCAAKFWQVATIIGNQMVQGAVQQPK